MAPKAPPQCPRALAPTSVISLWERCSRCTELLDFKTSARACGTVSSYSVSPRQTPLPVPLRGGPSRRIRSDRPQAPRRCRTPRAPDPAVLIEVAEVVVAVHAHDAVGDAELLLVEPFCVLRREAQTHRGPRVEVKERGANQIF